MCARSHPLQLQCVAFLCCVSLLPVWFFFLCQHVSGTINAAYGERCYNSQLGSALFDAKRFGQKSGQGYYVYAQGKPKPDATLRPLLEASRAAAASTNIKAGVDASKLSNDDLVEAVLFPVVNESLRIIDEGFARNESEVDVVSAMGQGTPQRHAMLFALI